METIKTVCLTFTFLCTLIFSSEVLSQNDKEQIATIRKASNAALKSYDHEKVLSYLTENALTTTGNGTLLCGKNALEKYIADAGESKMYWVRESKEITVNEKRGLAWETGNWTGYDPEQGSEAIIQGNYSAMWTKESGTWKIKSQLFVTLDDL